MSRQDDRRERIARVISQIGTTVPFCPRRPDAPQGAEPAAPPNPYPSRHRSRDVRQSDECSEGDESFGEADHSSPHPMNSTLVNLRMIWTLLAV